MWVGLLHRMLSSLVRHGRLEVTYPDGVLRTYGAGSPVVQVTLTDPDLPRRLVLSPDMGAGEGYMEGTFVIGDDDLDGFFAMMNSNYAQNTHWAPQRMVNALRRSFNAVRSLNPVRRAQANVAHHYDLSEELYRSFLDSDLQYSCAYFREADMSLEAAQEAKKQHIAAKLMLKPGMKVLDIGCGWGGMALTLARDFGVHVTGVTLSKEQLAVGLQRVREAGLESQIDLRLQDYRDVSETFDRVVSVGMFEHVGTPHYKAYFRKVRDCLTPDGVALIHTIGRSGIPRFTSPWIAKYIFPGGYVPSMSQAMTAIEHEKLVTTDVEVWRLHYAETLKHWRKRFEAAVPKLERLYDARFCRMFRWYLCASEMTFRHQDQVVFQFQLARGNDTVPMTRDYMVTGAH
ncbi:MAG: cyclopropane-fatty-acyl-phospholipid synthase family protein [Deltaproteobacteria bacterium]